MRPATKKGKTRGLWQDHRADEKATIALPRGGRFSLALAYANNYHVGMSSLGLQRVHRLVGEREGWWSERFFLDGEGMPSSVESQAPLVRFSCIAFSVSFEEDYVNLLRMLDRAGIPLRREERSRDAPLIVVGGSCATINPLPLAQFVDVFVLGAAENVLGELLAALEEEADRAVLLERLAAAPGFYVPAHHHPEEDSELPKLRKLELRAEQMMQPGYLASSCIVTPRTELSNKYLIEMSRGCPEKCRYCWATFGMGKFRWHAAEYILDSLEEAARVTDQLGFVATAVGDHPEIGRILREATARGFRTAVSSIRIPAVTEEVLEALHASGDRSITLAPETGNDEMRQRMGKPVTNQELLEKIRLIFRHGFTGVKLYFLVGLPGESLEDVLTIAELAAEARAVMIDEMRSSGRLGQISLGVNVLVPKPYTPWQREAMEDERSLKGKIKALQRSVTRLPNVSMGPVSLRRAIWQTYISRAGSDAADAIEKVARGATIASVQRELGQRLRQEVFARMEGDLRWHFLRTG